MSCKYSWHVGGTGSDTKLSHSPSPMPCECLLLGIMIMSAWVYCFHNKASLQGFMWLTLESWSILPALFTLIAAFQAPRHGEVFPSSCYWENRSVEKQNNPGSFFWWGRYSTTYLQLLFCWHAWPREADLLQEKTYCSLAEYHKVHVSGHGLQHHAAALYWC